MTSHARTARWLVIMVIASLLAGAAPAAAQDTTEEPTREDTVPEPAARHIYRACPAHEITDSGFVETDWPFDIEIECLAWYGIAAGVTPRRYRPGRTVSRGEMATFIANLIDESAEHGDMRPLPDAPDDGRFDDLGRSVHADNINRLAEAGIVQGGPQNRSAEEFGPRLSVRRDQMASFLDGAQEFMTGAGFVSSADFFPDDEGNVHEARINALANIGITVGNTQERYAPGRTVTRRQMAAFLMRLMDVNVVAGGVTARGQRVDAPSNRSFVFREVPDTAELSATELTDEGQTEFQVTGLGQQAVSLALFRCADVLDDGGVIAFRDDADPQGQADFDTGRDGAVIESVNGESRVVDRDRYASDVDPQDGTVTFTVDSTTTDCVVASAFADANDNDALDVDEGNLPTENFAVSGALLFQPDESGDGVFEGTVVFADSARGFFVAQTPDGQATYRFDPRDAFTVGDTRTTYARFHLALTRGDAVSGEYRASAQRTFTLDDSAPAPPQQIVVELVDPISVRVTWQPSATDTVTGYRILRLQSENWRQRPCAEKQDLEPPEHNDIVEGRSAHVVGEVTIRDSAFVDRHITFGETSIYYDGVCYAVQAIEGTDASEISDRSDALELTYPDILRLEVTRDAGRQGFLDPGDRHRFVFDREMSRDLERASTQPNPAEENYYNLGTTLKRAHVACTATGPDDDRSTTDCTLNRGDVTIDGTTYGPGRVLVVNVGTNLTNYNGGTDRIEDRYPLELYRVANEWTDLGGNNVDEDDATDNMLE